MVEIKTNENKAYTQNSRCLEFMNSFFPPYFDIFKDGMTEGEGNITLFYQLNEIGTVAIDLQHCQRLIYLNDLDYLKVVSEDMFLGNTNLIS